MLKHFKVGFFLLMTIATVFLTTSEARAEFCGENGVIRFSFSEGEKLDPVANVQPGENGVTMIDLYAWLTDVQEVKKDGEAFLGISAFELQLVIEGAEGFILKQEYPQKTRQVGKKLGNCIVGLYPGLDFENGGTQLVHWEIMFQGEVEDVVFRLDQDGLFTCDKTPGCPESDTFALYAGSETSGFVGAIFGSGYQPAYLNPTGAVDLDEIHGKVSWQEVGVFEKR